MSFRAATVLQRRTNGSGVVALGDSITLGNTTGTGSAATDRRGVRDPLAWAWLHSSGRLGYVRNAGIGGNTTAEMLARMPTDVVTHQPGYVIVSGGRNDIVVGITDAQYAANVRAIVATLRAAQVLPVLTTIIPDDGMSAAQGTQRHRLNLWLGRYAAAEGIPIADWSKALTDPATGNTLALYVADGVHPNSTAAKEMGRLMSVLLAPILADSPRGLLDDAAAGRGALSNLIPNGCNLASAAGVATGWTPALPAGSVASIVPAGPTAKGNWQRIENSGLGNAQLIQTLPPASWSPGEVLEIGCWYQAEIPDNGGTTSLTILRNGAVVDYPYIFPAEQTRDSDWTVGPTRVIREYIIPPGAASLDLYWTKGPTVGAVVGWHQFAQMTVRNLTREGVA